MRCLPYFASGLLMLLAQSALVGCSGDAAATGAGGAAGAAGATNSGGSSAAGSAGLPPVGAPGNPDGKCSMALPAEAALADVSKPTSVVGTGSSDSCTFASLKQAVAKGGVITFDCGDADASIKVTETLAFPFDKDTVLDGGGKLTLDGAGAVEVLRFESPNFQANDHGLTLQRITIANGKTTPKEQIPDAPAPCSQGFNDGEGGGLFVRDGYLRLIEVVFSGNQGAPRGPDTGGGGVYILGSKAGALIVRSTFTGNRASVGGGIGALFSPLSIYDSLFTDNHATGDGANNNDASKCSAMNNGQNEIGSGGNGGPIYSDGNSVDVMLCGDKITKNEHGAAAFGAGLFFTSNNMQGNLSIIDTTMADNTSADGKLGHWANVTSDPNAGNKLGTAIGTNCKSLTLQSSTLQGAK